ncbi:MBL fold metallo-hydrolase [Candidatus Falkowbacteria bacterium]|nr:MBL fold metallo-hydrolase [Candidatus Falkowbacteria bacterium]
MYLKFCGAAQNVTGSRHLLEINGQRVLLDCGMAQGGPKEKVRSLNENFLFNPTEIDYVVLSHAHIDHSGMLPRLVKLGFKGKIFCTMATRDLVEVLLLDGAHIQAQDAKFVREELGKDILPLFDEQDVRSTMKLFNTFEYFQKFKLAENVWLTFYDAGHVLGSAIIAIDFKEENEQRRLVFTGDLGRKYMPILNDPYQVDHAHILIIESTYASHIHDSFDTVHEELERLINEVVKRNGKIIVPGFSLERTQELVYVLHELYNAKKIPAIPIFVDSPLSSEIAKVFDRYQNYYDSETFRDFLSKAQSPFRFKEIKYISSVEESKRLNDFDGSCIIIAASGMCEAGRIKHHLKYHMGYPRNLILVVGFMAEGTRGRQIVEGERKIRLFGKLYPLRAEVAVINAFSAHADKLELLEYIRNINDLKNIFIVHGEETECAVLRDNIYNILKFKGKVDVVDLGEEFEVTAAGTESELGQRRQEYLKEMAALKLKV